MSLNVILDPRIVRDLDALKSSLADVDRDVDGLGEKLDEMIGLLTQNNKLLSDIRDALVQLAAPPASGLATQVVLTLGKAVPQVLTI